MQILHALSSDAHAVAQIHVDGWRAAYKSIVPADYLASISFQEREAMWVKCITAGIPELLVAKENDKVSGWLSFGKCRDMDAETDRAEIWAIYVAPSEWSTGVGQLLWNRTKELIRAQGFMSCSLWVFPQNDRAIRFYKSAGFSHDGSPPEKFELGGVLLQEIRLVARVDA